MYVYVIDCEEHKKIMITKEYDDVLVGKDR